MLKKLILIVLIISFFGCKEAPNMPDNFDYGSIEHAVYTNDYFKMRVPFDDSWYVKSQQEMQEIAAAGKELFKSDSYKKVIEASEINNAYLFTLYQFGPDELAAYNPSLAIVAENTKMYPHVKRGSTYLKEVQKVLNETTISYDFDMGDDPIMMGKHSFDIMDVSVDHLGLGIKQRYYTTVSKGFSLSIIISYTTEDQQTKLEHMVDGIVFSEGFSKKKN